RRAPLGPRVRPHVPRPDRAPEARRRAALGGCRERSASHVEEDAPRTGARRDDSGGGTKPRAARLSAHGEHRGHGGRQRSARAREPPIVNWSALAVLEPLASAGLAVLLALLLAVVAGEEAGALEGGAALGVGEDQGAGDPVTHGLGLGAVTAAGHG